MHRTAALLKGDVTGLGKDMSECSLETVKTFCEDGKAVGSNVSFSRQRDGFLSQRS